MPHFFIVILLILSLIPEPVRAELPKRFALVIGNSAYDPAIGVLANPENDVTDLDVKLAKELKFEVKLLRNATASEMRAAVAEFGRRLTKGHVGLFFYGGHGIAVNGRNYLLPTDTPKALVASDETELMGILDEKLIQLDDVLAALQSAKIGLAFLDSCRNAPGSSGRSGNVDFRIGTRAASIVRGNIKAATSTATGPGTFRAYATDPGNVASDGKGRNSPFVASLLKHMATPGETVDEIMRRVRADVVKETDSKQVPWTEDLLTERFIFLPRSFVTTEGRSSNSARDDGSRSKPTSGVSTSGSRPNSGGGSQKALGNLPPGLGAGAGAGL